MSTGSFLDTLNSTNATVWVQRSLDFAAILFHVVYKLAASLAQLLTWSWSILIGLARALGTGIWRLLSIPIYPFVVVWNLIKPTIDYIKVSSPPTPGPPTNSSSPQKNCLSSFVDLR